MWIPSWRRRASGSSRTTGASWTGSAGSLRPSTDSLPSTLCADAGLDQVIDDVWLVPDQPAGLQDALSAANTIWVGVHCPLAIVEQRERARGDRPVGAARGHHGLVHTFKKYDVNVDTSVATPRECADAILAVLDIRSSHRACPGDSCGCSSA